MYCPYDHADSLGLTIEHYPLRTGNALVLPERRLILMRPRLRRVHERSVLAHEIVHYEYMDVGRAPWQEERADRIAAQRLINVDALERAAAMYDAPSLIAHELDVTTHLLRAWKRAA